VVIYLVLLLLPLLVPLLVPLLTLPTYHGWLFKEACTQYLSCTRYSD